MKFNFSKWDLGGKFIFISTCLALISFFMKWVDVGFLSENGFGQGTVLYILLFIYPLVKVMQERPLGKKMSYLCAVIGIILGIIYISSKSVDFFGTTINAASTGPYVFMVSCLLLAFGTYKYNNN